MDWFNIYPPAFIAGFLFGILFSAFLLIGNDLINDWRGKNAPTQKVKPDMPVPPKPITKDK